jgi:hypothetical protein
MFTRTVCFDHSYKNLRIITFTFVALFAAITVTLDHGLILLQIRDKLNSNSSPQYGCKNFIIHKYLHRGYEMDETVGESAKEKTLTSGRGFGGIRRKPGTEQLYTQHHKTIGHSERRFESKCTSMRQS